MPVRTISRAGDMEEVEEVEEVPEVKEDRGEDRQECLSQTRAGAAM